MSEEARAVQSASEPRPDGVAWLIAALLLFALATADRFENTLEAGLRDAIPSRATTGTTAFWVRSDQRFVVWAVARNAKTLATDPAKLFDAEQCFPDEKTLALGEPVVAMGLLGIPAWVATEDPILTYNAVMLSMSMLAALAMYWLIVQWTGVPAAGIVAGLLYAFHGLAIHDPVHPYSSDTTWAVLALAFSSRLFARARWRDAAGLAAAVSMQVATSFYPLVAVVLVALPFTVWLVLARKSDFRRVLLLQLGSVAAVTALVLALIYGPYLVMVDDGVLGDRSSQFFRAWGEYLPGGNAFFGWGGALLVLAGVVLPRRLCLRPALGDPRIALVAGALLVAIVAAGPAGLAWPGGKFDLYSALSRIVPGLETVRIPMKMSIGVHLVSSLLAGVGAAGLIAFASGRAPRYRQTLASAALVSVVFVALVFGPGRPDHSVFRARPSQADLDFFSELAVRANTGPIFETGIPDSPEGLMWTATSPGLLLSAYHHRSTSACYPSHPPPHRAELDAIERELPAREAVHALGRLGFTTILVRHDSRRAGGAAGAPVRNKRGRAFHQQAQRARSGLQLVLETPRASAYEIVR